MTVTFNAFEVFEIAEQIERNGTDFYIRAAELFDDPKTREMFLRLAEWERQHEQTFARMKEQLSEKDRQQIALESEDFLPDPRVMAGLAVFGIRSDPAKELHGKQNRTEERLEHKYPVMFSEDFEQDIHHGLMLDISSGGMAFTCRGESACVEKGQQLTVQFSLPRDEGGGGLMNLKRMATVCWIDKSEGPVWKVGVQFDKPLTMKPCEQIGTMDAVSTPAPQ